MAHSVPRSLALAGGFVSPALSQRAIVLGVIVAFHVLLVYALATGLARTVIEVIVPPIELTPIPPVDKPKVPVQPPPPNLRQPQPIEFPKPDVPINVPPDDPDLVARVETDPRPVFQPPVTPRVEPTRLVGRHQLPNTEDYYPAPERRAEAEGAANVQVCVDERGKRQGEPTVTQSSGNARFDEAALEVVRDGRYARAMRGDTFVANCYGFRVIFKMSTSR
jgi:periplasmic protein TonB